MLEESKSYYVLARKSTQDHFQFVYYNLNQTQWQMQPDAYNLGKVAMLEVHAKEAQQLLQTKGYEAIIARHAVFNHTDGIDLDQMLFEEDFTKRVSQ